ncbi:MAG TPA: permease prefix domain 1-containing protein [Humibacter sp.]|nr:permease prefix domain 1-containing protein [Humibacter sp.]
MSAQNSDIHRYLDEVFAGAQLTPDVQDLKEELRGNLMARVGELQASGTAPAIAAARAIDELGDVRELISEVEATTPTTAALAQGHPSGSASALSSSAAFRRNHVRPRPAYVLRTVLLSLVLAGAVVEVVLCALGVLDWPSWLAFVVAVVAGAVPLGVIVADGVRQETTQNYPLPVSRAVRFGAASGAGLAALALVGLYAGDLYAGGPDTFWQLIAGVPLAIAALLLFVWLGVTKTNRKKQWVLAAQAQWTTDDRFSRDPVAAARFGIYTVIVWVLAFAAFLVLSFTVGLAWSWIALLIGFVLFFFILARMLFPADASTAGDHDRKDDHDA